MFARFAFLLAATAFVATACGDGDDYEPPPPDGAAGAEAGGGAGGEDGGGDSALVERGSYLVNHVGVCSDCHTPRDEMGAPIADQFLAGAECFVALPNGDCLHTRNLTNHATGLKNRTDEEIGTMIRDGLRPSAAGDEPLHPIMPYYVFHNLTDHDLAAIIAFLRTVPGVNHAVPRSADAFAVPAPAPPIDPDTIPLPADDFPERDSALRGRYLATQAGACLECHTVHNMGPGPVLDPDTYFAGGEVFDLGIPGLGIPVSKNLTSDATGLAGWEAEDIVKVLKLGADLAGNGICPPMPVGPMGAYAGLTDADALDIANYILSLPPIENEIDDVCSLPL